MANEKRLIDADALLGKFQFRLPVDGHIAECIDDCAKMAKQIINDAPTVDAVEVVRCKDCKYWGYVVGCGHYCECNANQMADTVEDDFCSYGERIEGE